MAPIFQPAFGRRDGRLCQTVTSVFEKSGHIGSRAPEQCHEFPGVLHWNDRVMVTRRHQDRGAVQFGQDPEE